MICPPNYSLTLHLVLTACAVRIRSYGLLRAAPRTDPLVISSCDNLVDPCCSSLLLKP